MIQLTYEQTMEARGLTLIATKAISSLMVEGKIPSAALNEHAQNSATTNLIMELYEHVVAEVEDASHEDHDKNHCDGTAETGGRTTKRSAVAEALMSTFLALNHVEQETEQYIGAIDLTEEEEENKEGVDDGAYREGAQFAQAIQPLDASSPQDAPFSNNLGRAAVPGQVTMADLWSAPISVSNASSTTPGNTLRAETSDEAPRRSATPLESSQRHVSWEEMRARLQLEAAARRAKRRRGASAKPGTPAAENSGLWAMTSTASPSEGGAKPAGPPQQLVASPASLQTDSDLPGQELPSTSLSPEPANFDADSVFHVQQPSEEPVIDESCREHDSKEVDDESDTAIGGDVGQLSLFG